MKADMPAAGCHCFCPGYVLRQQKEKMVKARRKLDKTSMEEHAQLASLMMWSLDQCECDMPNQGEQLAAVREMFVSGSVSLALELQGLLHEKKNDVSWKDIAPLLAIFKEFTKSSDLKVAGQAVTEIEASRFESTEYNLFVEKMKHDVSVVKIWKTKVACHESLMYHTKLEHTRKRRNHARTTVQNELFEGNAPILSFIDCSEPTKPAQVNVKIAELLAQIRAAHEVRSLVVMVYVNWCSPSLVAANHLATQQLLLASLLPMEDAQSMGLLHMPVWDRNRGLLYKVEHQILQALANSHINSDERASLSFEDSLLSVYCAV